MHYLANLQNRANVTSSSFCLSMAYGTLLGNPVMIVASGIGPTTAALCALELLQCRSGVHLTSLPPMANQAAYLSCALFRLHTGLIAVCSCHCSNLCVRMSLLNPGSSCEDLQQMCMLLMHCLRRWMCRQPLQCSSEFISAIVS